MVRTDDKLSFYVSDEQLALLKKHDFPCSEGVLASASATEDGLCLTGTRYELDDLVGWVAGEANEARRRRRARQAELLNDVADELESVLAARR